MHFFSPDVVVKLFLLLQLLGWLLLQLLLHATPPAAAAPNFYNFHPFSANLIIATTVFQKALWKLRRPRKIENALFPLRLNSSKNGKLSPWKSANSTEFVENNFPYNLLETHFSSEKLFWIEKLWNWIVNFEMNSFFGSEVSGEFPWCGKRKWAFLAGTSCQSKVTNWATILTDFHLLDPILSFLELGETLLTIHASSSSRRQRHPWKEGSNWQSIMLTHFFCHNMTIIPKYTTIREKKEALHSLHNMMPFFQSPKRTLSHAHCLKIIQNVAF